jgi:hypothetical protein
MEGFLYVTISSISSSRLRHLAGNWSGHFVLHDQERGDLVGTQYPNYTYRAWAEAFQIFMKYEEDFDISAEHDQIWAGPSINLPSEEDRQRLLELGWHIDHDIERFYHFV